MKALKKIISATILLTTISSSNLTAEACSVNVIDPYAPGCVDTGGCGYADCCTSPCLTPAIALGAIAIVAIIAVAVQTRSGNGHHGHGHN